jgi:hypothetical protein
VEVRKSVGEGDRDVGHCLAAMADKRADNHGTKGDVSWNRQFVSGLIFACSCLSEPDVCSTVCFTVLA